MSALLIRHVGDGMRHVRLADYGGFIRPEDTGLFTANAFTVWPQPVGMIQRDAGDNGDIRIHHIGGVKTTTEPDFQNYHVKLRLFEQPQR